jgi:hypothetical protein
MITAFCTELTVQMQVLTSFSIVYGSSTIQNVCHVVFQSCHSKYSTFTINNISILLSKKHSLI